MRKNWPVFIVASFLNTLLVTGAFVEFKLRGLPVFELPVRATGFPAWYDISPFRFAGGIFVISFLLIVAIIGIRSLITGTTNKLRSFNESITNGNALPAEA